MGDAPNYGARDPMGPAKARWHLLQAGLWRIAARAPPHEGTELNAHGPFWTSKIFFAA